MTTSIVWRAELAFATIPALAAAMADVIQVAPNEVAQVATHRAAALLSAIAKKNEKALLAIRSASGKSRGAEMGDFEDAGKRVGELASATVFLPSNVGGMLRGIPDPSAEALKEPAADVVSETVWRRVLFTQQGSQIEASPLLSNGESETPETYRNEMEARNGVIARLRSQNPGMLIRFETLIGSLAPSEDDLTESPTQEPRSNQAIAYFLITADNTSGVARRQRFQRHIPNLGELRLPHRIARLRP